MLKAIGHDEDCRRGMSDTEIITTAVIAAMFFNGNHHKACSYMKDQKLIPDMLEKSRFNRRLHNVSMLINDLFHQRGMILKETSDCTGYLLDSFPVPICDNIRIFNVKLIRHFKEWMAPVAIVINSYQAVIVEKHHITVFHVNGKILEPMVPIWHFIINMDNKFS